jgi:hypothetical protein
MTLAEVVFLVVFVCWLPLGALVGALCGASRRGDKQPSLPLEMCEAPRVRPVRRRREGCGVR